MVTYTHAWALSDGTVVYSGDDGSTKYRRSGSLSWRNSNPGNIRPGKFAVSCGAIGSFHGFAIFPTEAIGFSAIIALFKTPFYKSKSLRQAIYAYAPPDDNNNSAAYVNSVATQLGVSSDTSVGVLSDAQLSELASAIRHVEGWSLGQETSVQTTANADERGGDIVSNEG